MNRIYNLLLCLLLPGLLQAQLKPIGSWTEHLPFQDGKSIANDGQLIFAATSTGLFTYNAQDNSIQRYSTVNRLNDINIEAIAYSDGLDLLLVIYQDLNIDLLSSTTTISIPAIRDASLTNKSLNEIYINEPFAYLSTGFGIVKLNLERQEISETYQFAPGGGAIDVNSTVLDGSYIYAATSQGLFYANLNSNLLDFNSWLQYDTRGKNDILNLFSFNNQLYMVSNEGNSDSTFTLQNNSIIAANNLSGKNFIDRTISNDRLLMVYSSGAEIYNGQLQSIANFKPPINNYRGVTFNDERIYVINSFDPLLEFDYQGNRLDAIRPSGPFEENIFDISIEDGVLWAVAGGYDQSINNLYRGGRIYRYENDSWFSYIDYAVPSLNGLYDMISITTKPGNSEEIYVGCWGSGLVELKGEPPFNVYDETNSVLKDRTLRPDWVAIGETTFDEDDRLWIVNSYTSSLLSVRDENDNWNQYNFLNLESGEETAATEIAISESGYIWVALPFDNHILVFDYSGTLGNKGDDRSFVFKQGEGQGNLPGIRGITMAFDRDNQLWVGTSDGIAVKFNPDNVFDESLNQRDFERILLDDGENVEILLAGTEISDIEVDGANRKWIATNGSGVFLLSPDGKEVINHFTTENSPLFADNVLALAINEITGEVFMSTANGLISYRSEVVIGEENLSDVKVFPNPVRSDYNGPIAIDGLMEQSTVKITDINGRLINEIESQGGRAIWNGQNFSGERVSTGVYLVFSSATNDEESLRTAISKILFIR